VALVKLVDDHTAHARELGVREEPARQHALGDELDPGLRADLAIEADLVADFATELAAAFGCDPRGRQSRGESSRLQHDDLAGDDRQQCARNARRLAGAGWPPIARRVVSAATRRSRR